MTQASPKRAVCLLSGGLDSSTCLAIARNEGYTCYCLSFNYGQRHQVEMQAAANIAKLFGAAEHHVVRFDLRTFGGSALTSDVAVPKDRDESQMSKGGIPITYVPARNTIFLSFALAYAEVTAPMPSSSASTRLIIQAIPIAVRSSSALLKRWPIWQPERAWKAPRTSKFTRR